MPRKRVEFRVKQSSSSRPMPMATIRNGTLEEDLHPDDELAANYESFGTTPPRTRLKIKNRDWERKQKSNIVGPGPAAAESGAGGTPKKGMTKMARNRVQRRNTMDCALLNEMFVNEESKRTDKRLQSLLRDSEREMKSSLASATAIAPPRGSSFHEVASPFEYLDKIMRLSSDEPPLPIQMPMRVVSKVVESCNRYRCVSSRPIGCRASAPPLAFTAALPTLRVDMKPTPGLTKRKDFHETFANLIKLGSVDRQDGL